MNISFKNLINEPVSVLMPVCNEADVIGSVIDEWLKDVFQYLPEGSEFIFDDGASTDGTLDIINNYSKKYNYIKVYKEKRDGFGKAAKRLYGRANCPFIFFTDSDGQYVAKDFWILAKYINDYDFIRGGKVGRKDPIMRRLVSFIFNKLVLILFDVYYFDVNSAFFLLKKSTLDKILPDLNDLSTLVNTELLIRAVYSNYEVKQVYITHRERKGGVSRGLPPLKVPFHGLKAFLGLLKIKANYRDREL